MGGTCSCRRTCNCNSELGGGGGAGSGASNTVPGPSLLSGAATGGGGGLSADGLGLSLQGLDGERISLLGFFNAISGRVDSANTRLDSMHSFAWAMGAAGLGSYLYLLKQVAKQEAAMTQQVAATTLLTTQATEQAAATTLLTKQVGELATDVAKLVARPFAKKAIRVLRR